MRLAERKTRANNREICVFALGGRAWPGGTRSRQPQHAGRFIRALCMPGPAQRVLLACFVPLVVRRGGAKTGTLPVGTLELEEEGEKKRGMGSYQYLVVVITLPLDVTINIIK